MENAFRLLFGFGEDLLADVGDGIEAWVERVQRTMSGLKMAIGIPFGLFALAMIVGGIGNSPGASTVAQYLVDFACLAACVLLLGVTFNVTVLGQLMAFASLAAKKLVGENVPTLDPKVVAGFSKMLLVGVSWIAVLCSIAMHVPLWENLHGTIVILVGTLAAALIAMTWGFKAKSLKYIVVFYVVAVTLLGVVRFNDSVKDFSDASKDHALTRLDNVTKDIKSSTDELRNGTAPVASQEIERDEPQPAEAAHTTPLETVVIKAEDTQDAQASSEPKATKKPRIKGSGAKQIDDLYGDL